MDDANVVQLGIGLASQVELVHATRVSRRDDVGLDRFDMGHLPGEEFGGLLRLRDRIDTGSTAAPIGFAQRYEVVAGKSLEKFDRLNDNALPVAEVTRSVVGYARFGRRRSHSSDVFRGRHGACDSYRPADL